MHPLPSHSSPRSSRQIKSQSKVQLPLWLAFILIYSCVRQTHSLRHGLLQLILLLICGRDYADFTVPPPFSSRVRNALNAEAKSVRLSALVGAGGLWYGFGKIIMRLSVTRSRSVDRPLLPGRLTLTLSTSLEEAPANEMSELLTKARSGRPSSTRRVDLPW